MNDLAKRVVVAVVVFFLVAFSYVMFMRAQTFQAENEQFTEDNLALKDTAQVWRDSTAMLDTALAGAVQRGDSLAERTGQIRWHTRTVRLDGRVDTLRIATVRIDTIEVEIPQVVADEILACRALTQDCDNFRQVADSTIKWYEAYSGGLMEQIDHLSKRFDVPHLGILGLNLPLPQISIGYGVMYGLGNCSDSQTFVDGDIELDISTTCNNIHHGPVLSASWPIKLW